ncbi:hypothetical protein QWZ06_19355 [Chryseobacterium tructae]|uniref:Uncharacterized protein n=1 Tax=Chryseobacterium tructae TaxID=1037380 RepID=A0ABV7Y0D8_9FLAO|nr:hypothetical protein [Chryseobacterium tructae]MDN3694280.1 hypothetical protein [Chryseobacterium tructae]
MKYNEAIQYKNEAVKNADQSVLENYYIIVVPADTEESTKYIEEYSKQPGKFKDESCKKYCSNGEYLVVSFKKKIES